jgi:hypothetical protein
MRSSPVFWPAWVVVVSVLAWSGPSPASARPDAAYARIQGDRIEIGNGALERIFSLAGGAVRTTAIRNKLANQEIRVESVEFKLRINETELLDAGDFTLQKSEVQELDGGARRLVLTLVCRRLGIEVQLRHEVAPGTPWMRKTLAVRALGQSKRLLNRIEVESFSTDAACTLGGLGQPVFIADSVFTGLEYPAGHNQATERAQAKAPAMRFSVALGHLPGKALSSAYLESKPAVLGVAKPAAVEHGFAKYLAKIRIPPRTHVHYNSWYDVRQDKMSTEVFLETFAGFKKHLCDPYGVRMDSFVPDDGWQDRSSIWEVNKKLFPRGLDELSAGLRAGGSSLGLWHPLTAVQGNLVMEWCREHGYETDTTGSYLCLSAPKHNTQLREVMTRHVKQYGLTYLKHDFNSFSCDAQGHGHLPRSDYGFEANVDAYIEMLKLLKQLNPKIFLNCTGGMWLSPWWLMYCDTVWRGASDTGYETSHPFVDQRVQAISYVDGVLYDNCVKYRYQFPVSALMVHGIVYGQLHMLGGRHEPLESWTDNAVWSMCLGLMMKELYITPSLLTDAHWDVLGKSLRWAEANQDVLVETQMILGNPHLGEVTGYKHAVGDRSIVFVRNPSLRPQKAAIDFAPPEGDATRRLVEIVYPYRKLLARDADPARAIEIALAPNEMLAIEAVPASALSRPVVEGCRYAVVSESPKECVFDLIGEAAEKVSARVLSPVAIAGVLVDNSVQPAPHGQEATLSLTMPVASSLSVEDASGVGAPLSNKVRVMLPKDAPSGRFFLVCEGAIGALPLGPITVNGKPAKASTLTGDRWKSFLVPLEEPANTVAWEVVVDARPKTPFVPKSFVMSSYAAVKRPLGARRVTIRLAEALGPARPSLPTPFAAQKADLIEVQTPREVQTIPPGGLTPLAGGELKTIKAARLHLAVFGANPEDRYADKPVTLNGVTIGILPPNARHATDQWVERIMEIPADKLAAIATQNVVVVANCGGDVFKFADAALAVQRPDGTWVESNRLSTVYCSCGVGGGWPHHEGVGFSTKSPPIKLTLPVAP